MSASFKPNCMKVTINNGSSRPKKSLKAKVFQPMRKAGKMWFRKTPALSSLGKPTKAETAKDAALQE